LKRILLLVLTVFLAAPLYGKTTISAVASPVKLLAGADSKITVYCADEKGFVKKGVTVTFTVVAGGGTLSKSSGTSDGSGTVKTVLTTGQAPGVNAVKVQSEDAESRTVSVTGEMFPPAEFTLALEQAKIPFNKTTILTVLVKGPKGLPYKNADVKFNPLDLVTVSPMSAKTDAAGMVKAAVKAGRKTGNTRVEVAVGALDIQSIDLEVISPVMNTIAATAEDANIGTRGKTTITVKVFDTSNESMPNIPVSFQIESGEAVLNVNQSSTGNSGVCRVELTAGTTPGTVVVKVINKDFSPAEVRINVSASSLPPAYLSAKASDENAIAGEEVTLTATVEDREKRLVSGANVRLEVLSGGGSLLAGTGTTEAGKFSTVFILGAKPGKNTVKVTCNSLPSVTVTVNAEAAGSQSTDEKPGAPEKIFLYTNNRHASIFSKPEVTALVTDANNLPVPRVEVKFTAVEKIKLSEATAKTNSNGEAGTVLSYFGLGRIKVTAAIQGKEETIELYYGIPEWVYVFPTLLLFAAVYAFYVKRKNGLKPMLVESVYGLNNDLYLKYSIELFLKNKSKFSVCFMDIDDFKNYNISAGFEAGDKVLKELAQLVKNNVPASGIASHLGGDDFAFICEPEKAKAVAEKIAAGFKEKLSVFYKEAELNNGFVPVKNSEGLIFNCPLISLSAAIVDPGKINVKSYNELLNAAGRLLKSAKAKKENKLTSEYDEESERGVKKIKIGWFTVGVFLLALSLSSALSGAVDVSKKLNVSSSPEAAGTGQAVNIKARLTDNRERPIAGAYILFEDQNRAEGKGSFSAGGARTDKNGIAETTYTAGNKLGKAMVKASWKGDRVFSSVFISVHVNYLHYLLIILGLGFLVFTVLDLLKILALNPLFNGVEPETGLTTRVAAELKMKKLLGEKEKFHVLFADYRDFSGFNGEYGYEGGLKAAKALGEQIRSVAEELAPKASFIYHYGEDKFVLIAKKNGEELAKSLLDEVEILIPLLCEDKSASYYLLHLSVALVEVDPAVTKNIGEIMQTAGRLVGVSKSKPGSAYSKG